MNTHHRKCAGAIPAAFLASCTIGGIRVVLAPPDMGAEAEFKTAATMLKGKLDEVKAKFDGHEQRMEEFDARILHAEQKAARRGGGGSLQFKSLGQRFVESEEFKSTEGNRDREGNRIHVSIGNDPLERKSVTSASAGSLIVSDNRVNNPSLLPWNAGTIRSLVAPGQTASNAVFYPRQTNRTNNAAPQAGEGALKAESDMAFEQVMAPVITLAHYFRIARQTLDDAPALASIIDAEARSGLKDVEDTQMLFGNGTGNNLFGLVPNASPFVKQWNAPISTPLDVIIQAIAQVEAQNYTCDGLVLNSVDWRQLQASKDSTGRFIGNSPFDAETLKRIWNTPVATSNKIPRGKVLAGPFSTEAQIFDRMSIEVLLSSEDRDNWIRNLITARCEERLAFTIKRPASFVYADLNASVTG